MKIEKKLMITLNKKYKKLVNAFAKGVKARNKEEDRLFNALCKELNVDGESNEGESLWDHVYNGSDWTVKYE